MQKSNDSGVVLYRLIGTFTIYTIVMLSTNSWWGVIETSEARYSEISREMFWSQDYLNPSLLHIHHYHKPPITYWLTALGYYLFGINAQGARFFLVVAYLFQCLIVYRIGLIIYNESTIPPQPEVNDPKINIEKRSIWAAFIFGNLLLVLISVRALTTDAYNHLFILLTIWFSLSFKKTRKIKWLYLTSIFMGLAFLTKGPIIIIFLLPIYFLVSIKKEEYSNPQISYLHFFFSFILFSAIGLSWYVYLIIQNKDFISYFIIRHLVDRLVHAEAFMRHQPWYFYFLIFPAVTIPWFIPFVANLNKLTPVMKRIFWGWCIIPLFVFSTSSSKLVLYILPLCTGFSLITSDLLWNQNFKTLFSIIYIILLATLFVLPLFDSGIFLSFASKAILVAGVGTLILLFILFQDEEKLIWVSSIAFTSCLLFFSARLIKENPIKFNTITPVVEFIRNEKMTDRRIIIYNRFLPSLAFELNQPVISLYDNHGSLARETQFERNDRWKYFLFDLNQSADSVRFRKILHSRSVLITAEDVPLNRVWIKRVYRNSKKISRWTIHY